MFLNNKKAERGHELAYLVWDANTFEQLHHLRDVFDSCFEIRKEQIRVLNNLIAGGDKILEGAVEQDLVIDFSKLEER